MARVLSSTEAKESINRIQSIISGGLAEQLAALRNEGARLSDPNVWDGQLATDFRSNVWPSTEQALDKMKTELTALRERIDRINLDIMQAGGNA